ncbi:hypothetical protein [Vibrio barjaei]|uniref:hypothetical protein n=1 Tax=Vibrio barjaei TaxID=1676683 RepID=UPI002E0FB6ED
MSELDVRDILRRSGILKSIDVRKYIRDSLVELVSLVLSYNDDSNFAFDYCVERDRDERDGIIFEVRFSNYLYEQLSSGYDLMSLRTLLKLTTLNSLRVALSINSQIAFRDGNYQISIQDMKNMLGLNGLYESYSNFNVRIIRPVMDKIEEALSVYLVSKPLRVRRGDPVYALVINVSRPFCVADKRLRPVRPTLPKKPYVTDGELAVQSWALTCLRLLEGYRKSLRSAGDSFFLSLSDLEFMVELYAMVGDDVSLGRVRMELNGRRTSTAA